MRHKWIALLLALVCLLGSCRGEEPEDIPAPPYCTFVDDAGQEIILQEQPQHVAVLFSSYAEAWTLAGGTVSVTVGESVERGFADAAAVLVDDGAGKSINLEVLIAEQPDLVIASADIAAQAEACLTLNELGIPAAQFHVETFSDYARLMGILCEITEESSRYAQYVKAVEQEIAQTLDRAEQAGAGSAQKRILFVRCGSSYSATKAKTAEDNFVCVMLKELGTYNIAENAPILLDGLSIEEILQEDPDYIFFSTMGDAEAARDYMDAQLASAPWQQLSAVKNGAYTYLPKELFQYKPNARWGEAYQYLAELLYE